MKLPLPGILMVVFILALACAFALVGCAGTPNQQFDNASLGYQAKKAAYIGGVVSGKLPPPAQAIAKTNLLNLHHRLVLARQWLVENSALANTPSIQIPALDLWDRAISAIETIVPDVLLTVDDLPPPPDRPGAATRPAATQPASEVPIPIPG